MGWISVACKGGPIMNGFKDTAGRTWTLEELTLDHVMRLNKIGIELNDVVTSGALWNSDDSAMLTCGPMLWLLCKGQNEDATEESFYRAFDGSVFERAQQKLAEVIANFIQPRLQKPLRRQLDLMQKAAEKGAEIREHQATALEAVIDADSDEEMLRQIIVNAAKTMDREAINCIVDSALSKNASNGQGKQVSATHDRLASVS